MRPLQARRRASPTQAHEQQMLDVVRQFRLLVRGMMAHYKEMEQRVGMGGALVWALADIVAQPGLSMGELAEKLSIHLSTASNLVRGLEERGLIARSRSDEDQRVVRLIATASGRALLKRAPKPVIGALQQALLELPRTRLAALHDDLASLLAKMDRQRPPKEGEATPIAQMLSTRRGRNRAVKSGQTAGRATARAPRRPA